MKNMHIEIKYKFSVPGTSICLKGNLFTHVSRMEGVPFPCLQLLIVTVPRLEPSHFYSSNLVIHLFRKVVLLDAADKITDTYDKYGCFSFEFILNTLHIQVQVLVTPYLEDKSGYTISVTSEAPTTSC
jgi:hypothetical protein